jgi:hypothetical protein
MVRLVEPIIGVLLEIIVMAGLCRSKR